MYSSSAGMGVEGYAGGRWEGVGAGAPALAVRWQSCACLPP